MENFANFSFLFDQETRRLVSNIANVDKKLINFQLAGVFYRNCLNKDIQPIVYIIVIFYHLVYH